MKTLHSGESQQATPSPPSPYSNEPCYTLYACLEIRIWINYPSPQVRVNNTDATFVIVYFFPLNESIDKICVNKGHFIRYCVGQWWVWFFDYLVDLNCEKWGLYVNPSISTRNDVHIIPTFFLLMQIFVWYIPCGVWWWDRGGRVRGSRFEVRKLRRGWTTMIWRLRRTMKGRRYWQRHQRRSKLWFGLWKIC